MWHNLKESIMAITSFGGFGVGNWGTPNDIKAFQKYAKLPITGKVNTKTAFALDNYSKNNVQSLGLSPSESSFTKATPLTNQYFDSGLYGKTNSLTGATPSNFAQPAVTPSAVADDYNYGGVPTAGDVYTGQSNMGNYSGQSNTGSSFGSNWLYRDVANMPENIKNADPLVQAEWLKSPTAFQSGLSALGTGVSALSGLYGMYQAKQNYNLQKQQQDAVLAQVRASEANRSAIAKAFGSSYTPAQL